MLTLLLGVNVIGPAAAQSTISGNGQITGQGQVALSGLVATCGNPGIHCLADCGNTTVLNAVASAAEQDTIILPVCNVSWTQTVKLTAKHVNIIGQGVGQTVITDNVPKNSPACAFGAMNALIEVNDSTYQPYYGNILVPSSTPNMTNAIRISGMTIQTGIISTGPLCWHIHILSGSHQLRVDHITFTGIQSQDGAIDIDGDVWGVLDHITVTGVAGTGSREPVLVRTQMWKAALGNYGDNTWAQPSTYGTVQQTTIEDSNLGANSGPWCEYGSRCSIRHSSFGYLESHGTDSLGRYRSARHSEIYQNTFTCDSTITIGGVTGASFTVGLRGGTSFVWGNNFVRDGTTGCNQNATSLGISGSYYRVWQRYAPFGFSTLADQGGGISYRGACDGTSLFDSNMAAVATGTADAASSGDTLVVNPSPGWTTNQWAGYAIHNVTGGHVPVDTTGVACTSGNYNATTTGPWGSFIVSNTANTITAQTSTFSCTVGGYNAWAAGDSWEIRPVDKCLDNVGWGIGARLDGYPTQSTSFPFTCVAGAGGQTCSAPIAGQQCLSGSACGWVNEQLDPVYTWQNTLNGSTFVPGMVIGYAATSNPAIKFNREIYNQNLSFDGTSIVNNTSTGGVGVGTLASRPSTCTPQVGWWATDQNTLYQCTATNTWSVHYQPLTYPHPFATTPLLSREGRVIETADGHVVVVGLPERDRDRDRDRQKKKKKRREERREERQEERHDNR